MGTPGRSAIEGTSFSTGTPRHSSTPPFEKSSTMELFSIEGLTSKALSPAEIYVPSFSSTRCEAAACSGNEQINCRATQERARRLSPGLISSQRSSHRPPRSGPARICMALPPTIGPTWPRIAAMRSRRWTLNCMSRAQIQCFCA